MTQLLRDLRFAARALRAAPLTSAASILVIALGAGVNTAVLAAAYGILLQPLPYDEPSRLVTLSTLVPGGGEFGFDRQRLGEWRDRLQTVSGTAGFTAREVAVRGMGEPRRVRAAEVTAGFFELLGTPARRGDPTVLAPGSVVISERLAASLGSERSLGAALNIDGQSSTAVAVMPTEFAFPSEQIDVWLPVPVLAETSGSAKFRLVARLADGVSPLEMRQDALRVMRDLLGPSVGKPGEARPSVKSVEEALLGDVKPVLHASMAAAGLVLLVTCGNVAMLLLGQAALRRRESAVRLALGASRWALLRGAWAESLLLAFLGTALGAVLAQLALIGFGRVAAGVIPRWQEVSISWPVLLLSLLAVLGVTLCCGWLPALQARGADMFSALRGGAAGCRTAGRWVAALVVAQIAASMILLTGAGLLTRTVQRLLGDEAGIDPSRVLVMDLVRESESGAAEMAFADAALERIRALPGVEYAGLGSALPPRAMPFQVFIRWISETREEHRKISVVSVTPGFLESLGIRRLSGRGLEGRDQRIEQPAILISESTARFYSPERDLAGLPLPAQLPPIARFTEPPQVLGIVQDVKYLGLEEPAASAVYLPWSARPTAAAHLVLRTADEAMTLAPAIRRILRDLDPAMPISEVRTLQQEMLHSIADRRLRVAPALGFAAVALGVALCGIFALFARAAAERRREFAIRMALGATAGSVLRLMLSRATWLVAMGLALASAGIYLLSGGLSHLLYGVEPHDPATLLLMAGVVVTCALLAAWLPAQRASRVEPMELLRSE